MPEPFFFLHIVEVCKPPVFGSARQMSARTAFFLAVSIAFFFCQVALLPSEIHASPDTGDQTKAVIETSGKVIFIPEKYDPENLIGLETRTSGDGQIRIIFPSFLEVRAKENSFFQIQKFDEFTVSAGLAGFRKLKGKPVAIITPHCRIEVAEGIFVLRVYPTMTRLAVLRGSGKLTWNGTESRTILPRQEIAACIQELSDVYATMDDLYFAWYWDPPKKKLP